MTDYNIPEDNTLMVLDDDGPFRNRLGRALEHRARLGAVLRHAVTSLVQLAQIEHTFRIASVCRSLEQRARLGAVLRHAVTVPVRIA